MSLLSLQFNFIQRIHKHKSKTPNEMIYIQKVNQKTVYNPLLYGFSFDTSQADGKAN